MRKLWVMALSGLLGVGLAGAIPGLDAGFDDGPPPPPHEKKGEPKKGEPGPEGDLRRAYDLLRKIKAEDGVGGRADERLRGWTDRAAGLYRRGIQAHANGDRHRAHELGVAAHDLARAVDHAKNAARLDQAQADPDLPPPPRGEGPAGDAAEARRDLRHAYDRISDADVDADDKDAKYYLDSARDLYTAARRDAEDGRNERAAELAKAAEALTHVPEHLAHAADGAPEPPRPEPKAKGKEKEKEKEREKGKRKRDFEPKKEGPEPKDRDRDRDDDRLPPPLTPRA